MNIIPQHGLQVVNYAYLPATLPAHETHNQSVKSFSQLFSCVRLFAIQLARDSLANCIHCGSTSLLTLSYRVERDLH